MAHRGLIAIAIAIASGLISSSCGDPPAPITPKHDDLSADAGPKTGDFTADEKSWGKYHSKRFFVTVSLPDGKSWKIDDHSRPNLFALHEATTSKLWILATHEDELMNRAKCEARARKLAWVPNGALTTVADDVVTGPDAYDSRVWVALDAGKPGGAMEGHVFLFGSFLRQCLLVHFSTQVPSAKDEEILSSRLAAVDARTIRRMTLDPPRVTDDAVVPKQK